MFLTHLKEAVERIEAKISNDSIIKTELDIIKNCIHHIEQDIEITEEVLQELRESINSNGILL